MLDWNKLGRLLVLIDAANIEKSAQSLKKKVHYGHLKRFFQEGKILQEMRFYTAVFDNRGHNDFLMSLKRKGYKLITKPLKVITDKLDGSIRRKANFDVEIAFDARDMAHIYDTLILFSGDSDFNYLIQRLREMGKKVVVFSTRYHVAKELIYSCTHYYDINKFKQELLRQ